jgi:hypothetical protein
MDSQARKSSKNSSQQSKAEKTPEIPEEDHPVREDDWGAWNDHDNDWVLDGKMP